MEPSRRLLAAAAVLMFVTTGCAAAKGPTWTFAAPGTPNAAQAASVASAPPAAPVASAPAANAPAASMAPMASAAAVPVASAAPVAPAAAAPVADPNAPAYVLRDAKAPPVLAGTEHDIDLPIVDKDITVAKGFVVRTWTFGGTVPGPVIRVHLGDTVRVHLTNQSQMSHTIDFHASQTAMDHQMVEIKPGATFTYTFTADYAGVWMYHCGMAPALMHIANGMFGMVIVEPKGGLPKVDNELAFVQSEWYLGAQGKEIDYAKANSTSPAPDFVVFNGIANQYKDNPVACGSSCSTPAPTSTAPSTWSEPSSTPSSRKASSCARATRAAGAPRPWTWPRRRPRSSSSAPGRTGCTRS
jgi:nitrite reductase (NO-forming)